MQIERPHSATIIFRESRKGAAVFVGIVSAIILAWEWGVLGFPTRLENISTLVEAGRAAHEEVFYILAGLPVSLLPLVLRRLAVVIFGRVIIFDGLSRRVTKNGRILAGFDDVDRFRLRNWDDGDVRLHLFLKSGKKIRLGKLCHATEFNRVQTEITNLLNKAESVTDLATRPSRQEIFIPLSIAYYSTRAFSILLILAGLLLPVSAIFHFTDKLNFQGNVWGGSIFLLFFGLILYGLSWFLKYLRYIKL